VALSKTLGGGVPLAATITSSAIEADCVARGFVHVTSHVADPLPAAAGLAVLEVIQEEHLVEQAQRRGRYLLDRLGELQARHEHVGDVRGRGLLVGLELVEDRASRAPASTLGAAVTAECLRRGLSMNIARSGPHANCFRMAPPLTVTEAEIDTAVEILDVSIKSSLDELSGRRLSAHYAPAAAS
jgi:2,2-dialkylglycine decarboxylase (pyruvate)